MCWGPDEKRAHGDAASRRVFFVEETPVPKLQHPWLAAQSGCEPAFLSPTEGAPRAAMVKGRAVVGVAVLLASSHSDNIVLRTVS
jgi:hypothetical protein